MRDPTDEKPAARGRDGLHEVVQFTNQNGREDNQTRYNYQHGIAARYVRRARFLRALAGLAKPGDAREINARAERDLRAAAALVGGSPA